MLDFTLPHFFQNTFSPEECRMLLEYIDVNQSNQIAQEKLSALIPYEKRISSFQASFIQPTQQSAWLFNKLLALFQQVNERHYQFEYNHVLGTHIRKFKENDYYDWHHDIGQEQFSFRKLGFILRISSSDSYQGGEITFNNASKSQMDKQQGSICIFPAYSLYKIHPITSGEMALLCSWAHGERCFK